MMFIFLIAPEQSLKVTLIPSLLVVCLDDFLGATAKMTTTATNSRSPAAHPCLEGGEPQINSLSLSGRLPAA